MMLSSKAPGDYTLTLIDLRSAGRGLWIAKFEDDIESLITVLGATSFARALGLREGVPAEEALDGLCCSPKAVKGFKVHAYVYDKASRFGRTYRIVSWSAAPVTSPARDRTIFLDRGSGP